jgi:hypothetical protein
MWSWTILFTFALSSHVPAYQPLCWRQTLHGNIIKARSGTNCVAQICTKMTRWIGEGTDHLLQTRGVSMCRDWPVQLVRHPWMSSRTLGLFPLQHCSAGETLSKDPVFFNQFKDKICVVCCLLWVFWNRH